jgi:hypothetical protein
VPVYMQTRNGDSSRAGQFYNSADFAGISSDTYGTLTSRWTAFLPTTRRPVHTPSRRLASRGWSPAAATSKKCEIQHVCETSRQQLKRYAGYELDAICAPSDPFTVSGAGFTDIAGDFCLRWLQYCYRRYEYQQYGL